ncbi:MAG: class I SAM-dependent methyltransferase [Verrucomicrobia bacterium]|nr:MAG: class I SAM-dependent methyltransferase [Verrucomicrobiota bacterium]
MPKQGEIDLPDALGDEGRAHAYGKPFSDAGCGRYLRDVGCILDLLPPPPARLLDLGVGPGWTSLLYARRGYTVVGQDIAPGMIERARRKCAEERISGVEFVVQDYESMDFREAFDAAVFYDCLHHAEDEVAALLAVFRALKPGGVCLTVEPGAGHEESAEARAFAARFGVTERSMPPERIIAAARQAGFTRYEIFPRTLRLDPLATGAPADPIPPPPSRLYIIKRYLDHIWRCAFKGRRYRDARNIGAIPTGTFTESHYVRLTR